MKYKPTFKYVIKQKRSCHNNCVFCFIDQNPEGMREALYFKDDDSRLSFTQGTYITLTNLTDTEIDRIVKTKIPVNVSVHTTNPELRNTLMENPNAGQSLKTLYKFAEVGIPMNCQLVLCPQINDGDELIRSLTDLSELASVKSIACVPVGLTRFHKGGLRTFTKEEAVAVIETVNKFNGVFASDEFYLKAELPLPEYEHYGDFPQYENGVGMSAYMKHHFLKTELIKSNTRISIATGAAAYSLIKELVGAHAHVFKIKNSFFGESITVSGLLTAKDIIEQLNKERKEDLGDILLLPSNMFNADGVTLDDVTPAEIEKTLKIKIKVVDSIDKHENLCYCINNLKY
jgi:putative radical SAM enzyme (TIGR03279 family)